MKCKLYVSVKGYLHTTNTNKVDLVTPRNITSKLNKGDNPTPKSKVEMSHSDSSKMLRGKCESRKVNISSSHNHTYTTRRGSHGN